LEHLSEKQVSPPERHRSQAALFRDRILTNQDDFSAETGASIKKQHIIWSAPPMGGQFQVRPSRPAN
jgi:hypothetical protein